MGVGGFLIDIDHAVDYVLFERQRDLRPGAFLRYYMEGRIRYAVLVLHSYELFAALMALAWWTQSPLLSAYLMGALMHLGLDLMFNGQITPYSIAAFYSFSYRLAHRFDAHALLGLTPQAETDGFWTTFFRNTPAVRPLSEAKAPAITVRAPEPLA